MVNSVLQEIALLEATRFYGDSRKYSSNPLSVCGNRIRAEDFLYKAPFLDGILLSRGAQNDSRDLAPVPSPAGFTTATR